MNNYLKNIKISCSISITKHKDHPYFEKWHLGLFGPLFLSLDSVHINFFIILLQGSKILTSF